MKGNTSSFGWRMSTKTQDSRAMGTGALRLWFAHSGEARIGLERGNTEIRRRGS